MKFQRQTLKAPITFSGLGLHTGKPVQMILNPSDEGIVFRHDSYRVEAHPQNVSDTTRSTKLGEIGTVEHIMSALAGTEITDVEIELSYPEIPGMDGSAVVFAQAIEDGGKVELGERELPDLYSRIFLPDGDIKISIGKGTGHWRFEYDTGTRWPHSMPFDSERVVEDYLKEIAPARTFGLKEEVPHVLMLGLAQGLDADSALILEDDGYMNPARFDDEPARHKLLDLMGDLYLSGVPVRFLNVNGHKSGHRTQVAAAQMLVRALEMQS